MERKEKGKLSTSTLELPFIPVQRVFSLANLPTIEGNGFDPVFLLRISARLTPRVKQEDRPIELGLPLLVRLAPHHFPSRSAPPTLSRLSGTLPRMQRVGNGVIPGGGLDKS